MKLAVSDVKTAVVSMFKYLKENVTISRSIMEDIKGDQMEFLEMNITISEIKNSLKGINCKLHFAEEKMGKLEDITIETIQTKAKGRKKAEKYEERLSDLGI